MSFQIAIDGPAGAGKSTVAKKTAEELGLIYVDTGAMYRAIALYLLREQVDPEKEEELQRALDQIDIGIGYENGQQQIFLNGETVSSLIRTQEVSQMASVSSAKSVVRAKLLDLQQDLARKHGVVMDGRDIGTLILPDAQLKIFLTAAARARAMRRYLENQEKGIECSLDQIEADIIRRDKQDTERTVAPLKQAEDAVLVDSSDMTAQEVVDRIVELARERMDA